MSCIRKLGVNLVIPPYIMWLYYFLMEEDSIIERLREEYASGRMLTGGVKQLLV